MDLHEPVPGDRDVEGMHALVVAAEQGGAEEARGFLGRMEAGPAQLDLGSAALGHAIEGGRLEAARALLAAGADPNGLAGCGLPALSLAAALGEDALLGDLVGAGAALEYCHPDQGSALGAAVARGQLGAAERLLTLGAPAGARNDGGATALHLAAFRGDLPLVVRLAGLVDVDDRTYAGGTPLRAAAAGGHLAVVERLLALGADPSPVDDFGRTAADDARDAGHGAVVARLEAAPRPVARAVPPRVWRSPLWQLLPARRDAVLSAVARAGREQAAVGAVAVTAMEALSALGVARALAPGLRVVSPVGGEPDPWLVSRRVKWAAWTYAGRFGLGRGAEARAAGGAPGAAVVAAVASVARRPYLLRTWSEAARLAALGLEPGALRAVVGSMAHPVPDRGGRAPWDWRLRTQVAAALIASHLGEASWARSARRAALEDVAEGVADWACTAAMVALLDVAQRDEAGRASAVTALHRCARRPFNPSLFQHVVEPACLALLDLGAIEADERARLEAASG